MTTPRRMLVDGRDAGPVEVAAGPLRKFLGLMGRSADEPRALLIRSCGSVHTCFMRFALDVVYLDRSGRVTSVRPRLAPWRASVGGRGAAHVLELTAGEAGRLGIRPGALVEVVG